MQVAIATVGVPAGVDPFGPVAALERLREKHCDVTREAPFDEGEGLRPDEIRDNEGFSAPDAVLVGRAGGRMPPVGGIGQGEKGGGVDEDHRSPLVAR